MARGSPVAYPPELRHKHSARNAQRGPLGLSFGGGGEESNFVVPVVLQGTFAPANLPAPWKTDALVHRGGVFF